MTKQRKTKRSRGRHRHQKLLRNEWKETKKFTERENLKGYQKNEDKAKGKQVEDREERGKIERYNLDV